MLTPDKVVALALKHATVLRTLSAALTSELVIPRPFQRQLVKFATDFDAKYRTLPSLGDYTTWMSTLPEAQQEGLQTALSRLFDEDIEGYTPEYVADHALVELKKAASRTAVAKLTGIGENIDPEVLAAIARQVDQIGVRGLQGLYNLSDVDRLMAAAADGPRRTSGIATLDNYLGGGFGSEFVVLFADTGKGKTTQLVNFARAMMLHGAHVLHMTYELWAVKLAHRYYRSIAEAEPHNFFEDDGRQAIAQRLKHFFRYARGRADLLYRPAYSMTPEELIATVDQYVQQTGRIDCLMLDYMDLMAPSKSTGGRGNRRGDEILAQSSHLVRSICEEYDCTVITAGQATREGHGAQRLTMKHMGGAYAKNQAADILMTINQTDEEEAAHQARLGILKMRDHPGRGMEVPLYFNMALYYIADLDSPNTRRIMERLGHLKSAASPT